jgi:toxin-antitoxin system PIN domain toxin
VARAWVESLFGGTETVALAWAVMLAFVRLTTKPQVMARPFTVEEALVVVHPTDRHARILRELLAPLGTGGSLTTDAHLGALSIEHGAELCSSDADFSRFPGVRWQDPLRA